MIVGTISGKSTRRRSRRRRSSDARGAKMTFARSRFGVWSIGAEASLPWNVCPTTTVSMAPFASCEIGGGIFSSSAEPKRFATFWPASFARRLLAS